MLIESFPLGPGTLTFGVGGAQVASAQVTKCTVTCDESVKTAEAIPVLSGDELPKQDVASLDWKLTATVIQDIAAAGLVDYTWTNASEEVPFSFIPSTVEDREVSGTVRIVPISLGGDVKARNTSDLSWAIIGTPDLAAAL